MRMKDSLSLVLWNVPIFVMTLSAQHASANKRFFNLVRVWLRRMFSHCCFEIRGCLFGRGQQCFEICWAFLRIRRAGQFSILFSQLKCFVGWVEVGVFERRFPI